MEWVRREPHPPETKNRITGPDSLAACNGIGKEPEIDQGINLAGLFARSLRCSIVTDHQDMRLIRASPPGKIPAPT